ncbi:esterase/lipase superfamily enzyme [Granulicella aggregans]|jgi:esterase/lipase superfamily enzyme|uniref:Esterase/lipase superfamily enzyme n=1 Tax=Granulicella aggregans TaxID=474949 RepID=A0A7W7ZDT1_9BACT|nr:alpha/beta hydrolase-fold protein [Granulicella aggregans]MBB5057749.1 esterase/lipase superfamily enzyme [Granulicella aggregans]
MRRDYHKWFSPRLGRDMELLVFGHAGLPAVVFPTSQGRYFEFEDRGMVGAIANKIENGEVQLFCVDSVDSESWYNRNVPPRWKVARQVQYDEYIVHEVIPLVKQLNWSPQRAAVGCSFGGYHAVTMALRHPDVFTAFLSMSGAFDMDSFLGGYHDEDVYFNQPTQFLPGMTDSWFLDRYRQNTYVLATGVHDQCWSQNEKLGAIMRAKGIPVRLDVWGDNTGHDWPWWQRMVQTYL